MINRIKELFETNPFAMWTISFLLLVIVVFTPVTINEYENYQRRQLMKEIEIDSNFNWQEIQRSKEEEKEIRNTVTDEYFVTFLHKEDGEDMKEDGTMFATRWLWFRVDSTGKSMAFNYNGKQAVDNANRPLEKGSLYIVGVNKFGQVIDIHKR